MQVLDVISDLWTAVKGTSGRVHVYAGGDGYTSAVTITRPSNATAYTAGDVIGVADVAVAANAGSAIHEFTSAGASGASVMVTGADLRIDLDAVPAGMTSFRLHLYNASPTAILDNAAWDLPANDRAAYLGYIDIGTAVDVGSTLYAQADQINKQIKLASGSTSVFGLLVTTGAYTPASATVARVRLHTASL
jgi:hypothetical protein